MTWIYFVGSALGILLVVLLNRFLGGNRSARIDNESDVVGALERDHHPLLSVSSSVLDRAGRSGVCIDLAGGFLGLATRLGDSIVSRRYRAIDLDDYEWQKNEHRSVLLLKFNDFTLPRLEMTLREHFDRKAFATTLEALLEQAESPTHE